MACFEGILKLDFQVLPRNFSTQDVDRVLGPFVGCPVIITMKGTYSFSTTCAPVWMMPCNFRRVARCGRVVRPYCADGTSSS